MADEKRMMTEDEKKLMEECEEEFKDRYTDDDPTQRDYEKLEKKMPPIVDPWFNKPIHNLSRRNYGGRRHQNWDRKYDRNDRNDRHSGRHHMYQRNSRPY